MVFVTLKLSDKIEDKLAELGEQNDWTAWEIGDVTEYIFQYCSVNGFLINPQTEEEIAPGEIYRCVAQHARKSPQAIRDYRYTSRNVPNSVREKYPLGRHHFKALIPHVNTVGEMKAMCERVLEWSDDYGGQVISVAALRLRLAAGGNGELATWAKRYKRIRKLCKLLQNDETAPTYLRQAAERFRRASVPLP